MTNQYGEVSGLFPGRKPLAAQESLREYAGVRIEQAMRAALQNIFPKLASVMGTRRVFTFFLGLLLLTACAGSSGHDQAILDPIVATENPMSDLTILIIRHAEKPAVGSGLSAEGEARAKAYAGYFQTYRVDGQLLRLDYLIAADDSEHSQRSRLTLEPLGHAIGLKPDLRFQARKPADLVQELRSHPHGHAILICWHHHEIPELLEQLGADPQRLLPHGEWPAQQFGWVLQLRYDHQGRLVRSQTRRVKEHLMGDD